MIKINRKVEYALIALKYMRERPTDHLTSAREVCERFNLPFDTTAKVMQQLNLANVLGSVKGVKGGYYLQKPLQEISYLELVELIEGRSFTLDCQEGPCELLGTCNISLPITRLNEYLSLIFKSLSLEDILSEHPLTLPRQLTSLISKEST